MGNIGKDEDARPVKMDKKSKKSKKSRGDDLLDGDGDSHVEVDGGLPHERSCKHREKKRKSESNKDLDEGRDEKGKLEDDVDFRKGDKKKRKRDSENNHPSDKSQVEENEQGQDDCPSVEGGCYPKPRKEKRKHKHKHDGQERKLEIGAFSSGGILDNDITVMEEDVLGVDKNKERGDKSDAKRKKKMEDFEGNMFKKIDKKKNKNKKITEFELIDKKKKKKKKKKTDSQNSYSEVHGYLVDGEDITGSKGKQKTKMAENNLDMPEAKGKSKRVSFSGHVEVFPSSDTHAEKRKNKGDGLVRGKRFTPEEDAIVKEAVLNYIQAHDLGDEGLKMVLNCNSHPGMKKCWQEIGTCIPYRPYTAVYYRAHILFERAEARSWTPEEREFLEEFHAKHGNKWKMAAEELGKHRFHVKDAWRRFKFKNQKVGRWTQEEYQSLYDLVNLDLQMKVNCQEKKSKHGMLRDNIPWCAISEKLSTRSDATCCVKWYNQLTSSLVAENKWSDADDYRLIGALYELDAACVEDVDWDCLLEHRPGDVCRKRWNQMVLHIGHHGSKPFSEQVDTLAKRYCPDLAETREAWDNKPVVP